MDDGIRLDELFRALFDSDAQLRRFLVLEGYSVSDFVSPATRGSSRVNTSFQTAQAMARKGLITDALFSALERRSPGRRDHIWEVARFYDIEPEGTGQAPVPEVIAPVPRVPAPPPIPAMPAVPPELATFAKELQDELSAFEVPDPLQQAMDPDHWPWTSVGAVLGSFRPLELQALAGAPPSKLTPLVALADLVFTSVDGRWVLQDEVRARCLRRLADDRALWSAVESNERLIDARRDTMRDLLMGRRPRLATLEQKQLEDLAVVIAWLEPLGVELSVDREAVLAAVERRQLIEPLRALVGTHFRGRTNELAIVNDHLAGDDRSILLIQGAGGSGKSSLIAKVLLDLEDPGVVGRVAFAYVDFDKARHDPRDPIGLIKQIARQLRLLYATSVEVTGFAALESVAAGTDMARASDLLRLDETSGLDSMLDVLARQLRLIHDEVGDPRSPTLVLVLDTFEEVQVKGPGAVSDVLDLLQRLRAALPEVRIIVSGRAVVTGFGPNVHVRTLSLGDLDPEAADAVLQHLGVAEAAVRSMIIGRFGGNPLTLRLAAEAVRRLGSADRAFVGELARSNVLASVALEQVQGMLYSRILGHIGDPEVVKVAHPGLAVRRVSVDVIRDVLAGPCELDPNRAAEIFDRLRAEVTMFDADGPDGLRHRQDVRRLMLQTILDVPRRAAQVAQIHHLAIDHYKDQTGPTARAEELYHRLMSGQDPREFSSMWDKTLESSLGPAMEEPLPPRARRWLERRLGRVPPDGRSEWDQDDWEAVVASNASSWLASGDHAKALELLSERSERLPGSRLYAIEVAALSAAGDLDAASKVLDIGLRSAADSGDRAAELELVEQASALRALQGSGAGVVDAARFATSLCDLTGQGTRAILALTQAVGALQSMRDPTAAAKLIPDLATRFRRLTRPEMQAEPELVRQVLRTAGAADSSILVHAATQLGDQTEAGSAIFRQDAFALRTLLDQTSDSASRALDELAEELGLSEGWGTAELAGSAVRSGRTGKAVALGIDYASDVGAARSLVADELVQSADVAEGEDVAQA
jgi:hypothetical protein